MKSMHFGVASRLHHRRSRGADMRRRREAMIDYIRSSADVIPIRTREQRLDTVPLPLTLRCRVILLDEGARARAAAKRKIVTPPPPGPDNLTAA